MQLLSEYLGEVSHLLCPACDMKHLFVQCISSMYATHLPITYSVAAWLSDQYL